jgi:hypothetical protein
MVPERRMFVDELGEGMERSKARLILRASWKNLSIGRPMLTDSKHPRLVRTFLDQPYSEENRAVNLRSMTRLFRRHVKNEYKVELCSFV